MKHTPTPYQVYIDYENPTMYQIFPRGVDFPDTGIDKLEQESNREFIERACNSHDKLVKALEMAINDINSELGEWQAVDIVHVPLSKVCLKRLSNELEQALAEVKGGS